MGRLMGLEEAVEKLRAALSLGVPPEREIINWWNENFSLRLELTERMIGSGG
jgi:hypothetical protein